MNNQIAVVDYNPLSEIQNTNNIMDALIKLPHYQKMGKDVVFAMVAKAQSLKMDPIYALNGGLYNINGKIGMPAEAMAAMIREKGHSISKDPKSTDFICILHGRRVDNGDTWTCSFSVEDAKKAGIYKNSWEKYQSTMCYNRAMSFLARQLFPDVIKGSGYTPDELHEIAANSLKGSNTIEAEIVREEVKQIEEKPLDMITPEQAKEFDAEFSECSPEYKKKILMAFTKKLYSLDRFPAEMFEKALAGAKTNAAEYKVAQIEMRQKADEMRKAQDGE